MSEMIDRFYKAIEDIKNMFTVAQAMAENSFKVSEENTRLREALEKLKNEFIHHGEIWDEPEIKTLKEWYKIVEQALKE